MITNEDFFSSNDRHELMTKVTAMLFGVLDPIPLPVEALRAIRRNEQIIDFEYVFLNTEAQRNTASMRLEGNTFLTIHGLGHLFDTMVRVTDSGIASNTFLSLNSGGKDGLYKIKCVKLGNGVLMYYEKSDSIVAVDSPSKPPISEEPQVAEIREARTIIKKDEHLIGQIMDTTPDIIYIMDLDTTEVIYANRKIAEELGYSQQQIQKMKNPIFDILFEDDVVPMIEHFKKLKTFGIDSQILEIEYRMKDANGEISWFCDRNSVFKRDAQQIATVTIGITQNITKRKLQEQENNNSHAIISDLNNKLVTKNRDLETLNSELKTFNTVASRDYKETIQTLYTNLEYIASKEARNLSDTARGNIRKAQGAIQKMKLLTEDINAYLHLSDQGISKSWVDPNDILTSVLSGVKGRIEQAGAKIESETLPLLPADPVLFAELLIRLIDNSIKFRKLTVAPVIKIAHSKADKLNDNPEAIKNTPYIIITVSDNGIGFSDEEAEKIFALFYRAQDKSKYRGSGIGLAICKKIMLMHGGFTRGQGSSANGATFSCYFPATLNND